MATNELTCQGFIEIVTAYLEGALPDPERARFEAHLNDCPYCSTYLDQMRQTIRLVGRLSEESLAPEVKADLLGRFRDWNRK
ncbi:MAG TPA: zf-HC2 domain-containing protein [Thermomicrobiales bacterium]|nr:zf-HC2 domain-containing protein [Thermomicrobiales bacterium]